MSTMSGPSNGKSGFDQSCGQLSDLEYTIADFERLAQELDQQIRIEQQISGISDVSHFAYPTFAKAAAVRRDNLLASIADLRRHLEKQREQVAEAGDANTSGFLADGTKIQPLRSRQRRKQIVPPRFAESAI